MGGKVHVTLDVWWELHWHTPNMHACVRACMHSFISSIEHFIPICALVCMHTPCLAHALHCDEFSRVRTHKSSSVLFKPIGTTNVPMHSMSIVHSHAPNAFICMHKWIAVVHIANVRCESVRCSTCNVVTSLSTPWHRDIVIGMAWQTHAQLHATWNRVKTTEWAASGHDCSTW